MQKAFIEFAKFGDRTNISEASVPLKFEREISFSKVSNTFAAENVLELGGYYSVIFIPQTRKHVNEMLWTRIDNTWKLPTNQCEKKQAFS